MELNILKQKENPLFNRKEIIATVESRIAPSRESILKLLEKKFSVQEEAIKIKSILGRFGSYQFKITANIYSSKEDKNKIEIKKKKESEKKPIEIKETSKQNISKEVLNKENIEDKKNE